MTWAVAQCHLAPRRVKTARLLHKDLPQKNPSKLKDANNQMPPPCPRRCSWPPGHIQKCQPCVRILERVLKPSETILSCLNCIRHGHQHRVWNITEICWMCSPRSAPLSQKSVSSCGSWSKQSNEKIRNSKVFRSESGNVCDHMGPFKPCFFGNCIFHCILWIIDTKTKNNGLCWFLHKQFRNRSGLTGYSFSSKRSRRLPLPARIPPRTLFEWWSHVILPLGSRCQRVCCHVRCPALQTAIQWAPLSTSCHPLGQILLFKLAPRNMMKHVHSEYTNSWIC